MSISKVWGCPRLTLPRNGADVSLCLARYRDTWGNLQMARSSLLHCKLSLGYLYSPYIVEAVF